ncbi:MAG: NUDIX domain-containing protein [Verrucomicrobia bacterium]|nr:NUDIX domain-containing protein [Verrucomicrobiota bacterium]
MAKRQSAGLLMYRRQEGLLEIFIAHPGGPRFSDRDEGVWSIPKGEWESNEIPFETAIREFEEETGIKVPSTEFFNLESIQQKGGKIVHAWAFDGQHISIEEIKSNRINIEWPKGSGKTIEILEIDRAQYLPAAVARKKLKSRQIPFIDRLEQQLEKQH